jgi:F-type H+-transporting ATPase subunit delta
MSVETIARRYAGALADVVVKSGKSEEVKAELGVWQDLISSSNELSTALLNPSIAHAKKESVLESLIDHTKPTRTTANFLRVLLRNSRLMELRHINEKFESVLEERGGITSVSVISSRELNESERNGFATNIKKVTGTEVKLTFAIDESLIGGAVTRVGSTVYDGSVKSQLKELKEQMTKI